MISVIASLPAMLIIILLVVGSFHYFNRNRFPEGMKQEWGITEADSDEVWLISDTPKDIQKDVTGGRVVTRWNTEWQPYI